MKRKVFFVGVLLLSPVLGILVAAREAASWRPVLVGTSPDFGELSVSRGGWIKTESAYKVSLQRNGRFLAKNQMGKVFFSPDESLVALSGGEDYMLRVVQVQSGKTVHEWSYFPIQGSLELEAGRFENNNRTFVAASQSRVVYIDVESGKVLSQVKMRYERNTGDDDSIMSNIAFLQNGDLYYPSLYGGTVVDARTGISKKEAQLGTLSPDNSLLLQWFTNSTDLFANSAEVRIVDFATGRKLFGLVADSAPIFSPDSRSLLVVQKGKVRLLDARTGKIIRDLKMPPADSYAFSPDGNALYSLQPDKQILRWRLR